MSGDQRGDRLGRLAGGILIAEGLIVAAARVITLVYVLAREAYVADRFRTPLPRLVPWLLTSAGLIAVLVWAGSLMTRTPDGAWREARVVGRVVLLAALVANVGALVWTAIGSIRSPATIEALTSWLVVGLASAMVAYGLIRDVVRR